MTQNFIQQLVVLAPPFLLAITFHEFSHGYIAWKLGDPTAQQQGRLSMNPLRHLDPIGVLAFIIMKIGWAKPVPVNASYFKNPVRDMMWVSVAGPGSNLLLALASALLIKLVLLTEPIIPAFIFRPLAQMVAASIWINLMLAFFNLIPVPPLDGSRIISGLLPPEAALFFQRIEPFGFIILLILFYLGIIPRLILPMTNLAHGLLTG